MAEGPSETDDAKDRIKIRTPAELFAGLVAGLGLFSILVIIFLLLLAAVLRLQGSDGLDDKYEPLFGLMCAISLVCAMLFLMIGGLAYSYDEKKKLKKKERCVGAESMYRGFTVRCSKKPKSGSDYCEEHQNQRLWGFKGDNKVLKYSISVILIIFFYHVPNEYDDFIKYFDINLILYYFIYISCIILFIVSLGPVKAYYNTHEQIDEAIEKEKAEKIASDMAQKKDKEDARFRKLMSKHFRKHGIYTKKTTSSSFCDGDDTGDWGSGLGDTMGADDDG